MPNDNLQQALTTAAARVRERHPELTDADVHAAYTTYREYFSAAADEDPPVSDRPAVDDLLLGLWDEIVDRETAEKDRVAGKLEDYYVAVFGTLVAPTEAVEADSTPVAVSEPVEVAHTPAPVQTAQDETAAPIIGETRGLIYKLKVYLDGANPAIWRTILVPSTVPQTELHHIIQSAMGWRGTESFEFLPQQKRELPTTGEPLLSDLLQEVNDECGYEFDRAGSWYHTIVLEDIQTPEGRRQYPVCIAGQRACPPEDVGGIREYEEMLAALKDPTHPDYREMAGWLTQGFNPATFNIDQANLRLARHGQVTFEAAQ